MDEFLMTGIFQKTIYNPYRDGGQEVKPVTPEEYRNMLEYLSNLHLKHKRK